MDPSVAASGGCGWAQDTGSRLLGGQILNHQVCVEKGWPRASLFITVMGEGRAEFKGFSGQEMKSFGSAPGTSSLH